MAAGERVRILYMEDDPGLAQLFKRRLERLAYLVALAGNGTQGLGMYATGHYDVIALDQTMPDMDGLAVLRELAACGDLPPTIMVTGSGNERIAVQAMKLGAGDYLVKDLDGGYLELLPTVIEQVLERHRWMQEKRRAEEERARLVEELQAALAQVRKLSGLLPICSCCKKIRNDSGYWTRIEEYIAEHSEAEFTHGICPECMQTLYGEFSDPPQDAHKAK
ncbi:MAG: response regulator [Anaerolineae bacterium]